jgi:hypothetical protein
MRKNPNQPFVMESGILKFKQNKIIRKMLDICTKHGYSLNEIYDDFPNDENDDDCIQLFQLIGYSVGSYLDIGRIDTKEANRTMRSVREFKKKHKDI